MKIMIPDSPEPIKELADAVLATLTSSIHWFKIPTNPYQREVQRRQWALAIRHSGLDDDGIGEAVGHYLSQRWGKDAIPEPRDVFDVPAALLAEWRGAQAGTYARMREISRYLTIVKNWRGENKMHWLKDAYGGTHVYMGTERKFTGITWEDAMGTDRPEGFIEILKAAGEHELAQINEQDKQHA